MNFHKTGIKPFKKNNYTFIGLETTCPDGAVMYAGMIAIRTDASGNIIGVNYEYWGDAVACEDHQVMHFV